MLQITHKWNFFGVVPTQIEGNIDPYLSRDLYVLK